MSRRSVLIRDFLAAGLPVSGSHARRRFNRDFGNLERGACRLVIAPRNATELHAALCLAAQRNIPARARAAGHSMGGQTLSDGVVLDLRGLSHIAMTTTQAPHVECGAGATWEAVLQNTRGWLPTVMTDNPWATVGGTLASGGLGLTSFRHGFQGAHVCRMELVSPQGIIACDHECNGDLMRAAVGGQGRFGVITSATLPLVKSQRRDHWRISCATPHELLERLRHFSAAPGVTHLGGFLHLGEHGHQLAIDVTERSPPPHARHLGTMSDTAYALRSVRTFSAWRKLRRHVFPWVEALVAPDRAARCLDALLAPPAAHRLTLRSGPVLVWPVRQPDELPMLPLPAGPDAVLIGVLPCVPRHRAAHARAAQTWVKGMLQSAGAIPLLNGWITRPDAGWRQSRGRDAGRLSRLRDHVDPQRTLSHGPDPWTDEACAEAVA